jgi:hypothetical protein
VNPHAQPYAFPAGKSCELAAYLTEKTEYDPATGCLEWTGSFDKEGQPKLWKGRAEQFGSSRAARLAWQLGHGRKLDKGASLVRTCGNPKCIQPHHLREATSADLWRGEDGMEPKRQGSVGSLRLGKRILHAQEVYQIQTLPPPRDPSLGLRWAFRYGVTLLGSHGLPLTRAQRERLEIIRAVRRCPIRASRTELPCGFIRYDLPAGITEIAFTELPPPSYEDVFGWQDEPDEDPADAPDGEDWAITAKAA